MSNTDFDLENVIPVTEANLRDEQKQAMAKAMEEYKQQGLKSFSINRSSKATTAVAGTEATSPPSTLGITNVQSTPMTTNPSTSDKQIKLATDLLASAMSGFVPPNWWGFGMPPEMMVQTPGTSQVADLTGKAPMASAPLNPLMNQSPQYITTTTARPYTGNSQAPMFQMPNASADTMPMPNTARVCQFNDDAQFPAIGRVYADEC